MRGGVGRGCVGTALVSGGSRMNLIVGADSEGK